MFGKRAVGNAAQAPVAVKSPAEAKPASPPTQAPTSPTQTPSPPKPVKPSPSKTKASKEKLEQFNSLKMRLHRKLIDQLDLTRMVGDDDATNRLFVISFPDAASKASFFSDARYVAVRREFFEPAVGDYAILSEYEVTLTD